MTWSGDSTSSGHAGRPIQFLIRRTAQHVTDHAWEIEDRDPTV
jgi:hypothetical protein